MFNFLFIKKIIASQVDVIIFDRGNIFYGYSIWTINKC